MLLLRAADNVAAAVFGGLESAFHALAAVEKRKKNAARSGCPSSPIVSPFPAADGAASADAAALAVKKEAALGSEEATLDSNEGLRTGELQPSREAGELLLPRRLELDAAGSATHSSLPYTPTLLPPLEPPSYVAAGFESVSSCRVNAGKNVLEALPSQALSELYSAECYVIIHAYTETGSGKQRACVWLWLGRDAPPEATAIAATLAKTAARVTAVAASTGRVVQGGEPAAFVALFSGGLTIHKGPAPAGGAASGAGDAPPAKLFQVKVAAGAAHATEVAASAASLNSRDVFFLVPATSASAPTVWCGRFATSEARAAAVKACAVLAPAASAANTPTPVTAEGEEMQGFWAALGGKAPYPSVGEGCTPPACQPRLFRLIESRPADGTKGLKAEEQPVFAQGDLVDEDVFLLDAGASLFVWQGPASTHASRDAAAALTVAYASASAAAAGRSVPAPVVTVAGGAEPRAFTRCFSVWDARPRTPSVVDPSAARSASKAPADKAVSPAASSAGGAAAAAAAAALAAVASATGTLSSRAAAMARRQAEQASQRSGGASSHSAAAARLTSSDERVGGVADAPEASPPAAPRAPLKPPLLPSVAALLRPAAVGLRPPSPFAQPPTFSAAGNVAASSAATRAPQADPEFRPSVASAAAPPQVQPVALRRGSAVQDETQRLQQQQQQEQQQQDQTKRKSRGGASGGVATSALFGASSHGQLSLAERAAAADAAMNALLAEEDAARAAAEAARLRAADKAARKRERNAAAKAAADAEAAVAAGAPPPLATPAPEGVVPLCAVPLETPAQEREAPPSAAAAALIGPLPSPPLPPAPSHRSSSSSRPPAPAPRANDDDGGGSGGAGAGGVASLRERLAAERAARSTAEADLEERRRAAECVVCLERPRGCVLLPCGA